MMTRSMLQIMLEFAAVVQVPEADVAAGEGGARGWSTLREQERWTARLLRVLVTDTPPKDAYVATQYNRRWFWIADTDIQSKYTFGDHNAAVLDAETGVRGAAPVVTIPANQ